ncbi:hypothetical protein LAZ67_19001548 [Cordylochernes scorpioides]|uniref:CCHC-type domain-containing protein n=1 Tax=Cordylochernes scorpioides TaxID=51811 RepID=A0ABY6LLL0_9ARAC|nr:hypothetical protein LAZ67_19001548 [Cordylochernes scorpioides]
MSTHVKSSSILHLQMCQSPVWLLALAGGVGLLQKSGGHWSIFFFNIKSVQCGNRTRVVVVEIKRFNQPSTDPPKNYEMIKSKSKTNSTTSKVIPKPIDDKESKCFNCGKRGHLSRESRFKDLGKKWFSCNSFGHIENQCPTKSNVNTLVKQVQTKPHDEKQNYLAETTQKGRMFKDIKINDHEPQALIDTGSQLNLIRIDRYLAIGSPSFDADDRFISGIGNKRVKLLGKFKAEVKIDDVLFVTIFNIVPEDSMKVEVIIGDEMLKEVHFSVVGDNIQIKPIQDDWIGQIGDVFHTESCPLDLAHNTDPQLARHFIYSKEL